MLHVYARMTLGRITKVKSHQDGVSHARQSVLNGQTTGKRKPPPASGINASGETINTSQKVRAG